MRWDKEKGRRILEDGAGLVDASGRIKNLGEKSVLAFATLTQEFSVRILSREKLKIFTKLIKRGNSEKRAKAIIHSVKIYYAIRDYVGSVPVIYVCCDGFDIGLLKHYLKQFLKEDYLEKRIIILPSLKKLFGKKNIAHNFAMKVRKGSKKPTMELRHKNFENLKLI